MAMVASRRAGGTGGRAACAGDPVGGPVTVCRAGCDVIRTVCPQAAGERLHSSAASLARARAHRLLTVPSATLRSSAAAATE